MYMDYEYCNYLMGNHLLYANSEPKVAVDNPLVSVANERVILLLHDSFR